MTTRSCRHEADVQTAAMSGRWPAPLEAHARECTGCRDVKRIVEALQAPLTSATPTLDASALWACGRHARRISAEARVSTIVAAAQTVVTVSLIAVASVLIDWSAVWATVGRVRSAAPYGWLGGASLLITIAAVGLSRWLSSEAPSK